MSVREAKNEEKYILMKVLPILDQIREVVQKQFGNDVSVSVRFDIGGKHGDKYCDISINPLSRGDCIADLWTFDGGKKVFNTWSKEK